MEAVYRAQHKMVQTTNITMFVLLKNYLYVDVSIIMQMMDIAARRQMLSLEEVQVPLR
jgi:hypothetical protein